MTVLRKQPATVESSKTISEEHEQEQQSERRRCPPKKSSAPGMSMMLALMLQIMVDQSLSYALQE